MRLGIKNDGIRFQFPEVLVVCGTAAAGAYDLSTLGITLITLGVASAIMRFAVTAAEKEKLAEVKQGEAERLRNATDSLASAFSGFGKSRSDDD